MAYAYTLCGHEYVVNEDFDKVSASRQRTMTAKQRQCGIFLPDRLSAKALIFFSVQTVMSLERLAQVCSSFPPGHSHHSSLSNTPLQSPKTRQSCARLLVQFSLKTSRRGEWLSFVTAILPLRVTTPLLSPPVWGFRNGVDQAMACFRLAIRCDRRHYNAWYGLGSIYQRQEKFDMAEYHFRRALSINPQSR